MELSQVSFGRIDSYKSSDVVDCLIMLWLGWELLGAGGSEVILKMEWWCEQFFLS